MYIARFLTRTWRGQTRDPRGLYKSAHVICGVPYSLCADNATGTADVVLG